MVYFSESGTLLLSPFILAITNMPVVKRERIIFLIIAYVLPKQWLKVKRNGTKITLDFCSTLKTVKRRELQCFTVKHDEIIVPTWFLEQTLLSQPPLLSRFFNY